MIKCGWSKHALGKYIALQIPAAALAGLMLWLLWRYNVLSSWLAWCLLFLWIAKDAVLFFYLWPAYEPSGKYGPLSPVGQVGVVMENPENKNMRVRVRGESWRASSETDKGPLRAGQSVRVVDREGLLLVVRPEENDGENVSSV